MCIQYMSVCVSVYTSYMYMSVCMHVCVCSMFMCVCNGACVCVCVRVGGRKLLNMH